MSTVKNSWTCSKSSNPVNFLNNSYLSHFSPISYLYLTNFQSQLVNELHVETHLFLTEDGTPHLFTVLYPPLKHNPSNTFFGKFRQHCR